MNHLGDTNKMVDTPRTDAGLEYDDTTVDGVKEFARRLEGELNAANAEIVRLTNKVAQLYEGAEEQKQRIKRLEEAGDAMADMMIWSAKIMERESPSALAWLRAKEAKL